MRDRIVDVMAAVFAIDRADLAGGVVFGKCPNWDSLRHMNLVLALEEEFSVSFTDEEITDMLSLDLIVEVLSHKHSASMGIIQSE